MSTGIPYRLSGSILWVKIHSKTVRAVREVVPEAPTIRAVAKPPAATVAERLVVCREATKLSQAEAARKIKITQQSPGDLETGKSKQPAADTLLDMRDKLNYNPDYVIRGNGMALLPKFEELAQEQALILIFRELRPEVRKEAVRALQGLRRTQRGGASDVDPFELDPPAGDDD